jgi:hypothetical protein
MDKIQPGIEELKKEMARYEKYRQVIMTLLISLLLYAILLKAKQYIN